MSHAAQPASPEEELAAADQARIDATISTDEQSLKEVLSEDLRYAHSTGVVDDQESLIARLTSGDTRYLSFDYLKREFSFPAETVALMSGQVRIKSESRGKGLTENTFSFLAVWKLTSSGWKFHAWQSAVLSAPPSN
jgi:hypothetical protein